MFVYLLLIELVEMPGWARLIVGAAWLHGVESMIAKLFEIEMFKVLGATLLVSD